MSNVQITQLPVAISLSGTEEVEVVQSGTSRRATTAQISGLTFGPTGPTGPTGATGPTGPVGLNPKGAWSSVAIYYAGDLVNYNNLLYASIVDSNTNNQPSGTASSNAYWMYIPSTSVAAGLNTQVQFNDSGLLGGDADFTYNKTTNVLSVGGVVANASGKIGYSLNTGGSAIQLTSRTTSVTVNNTSGIITLTLAAGSASWQTFTVYNGILDASDTVIVNQRSGSNLYILSVTNIIDGSFNLSFASTGGTTVEQPVFSFAIIKADAQTGAEKLLDGESSGFAIDFLDNSEAVVV